MQNGRREQTRYSHMRTQFEVSFLLLDDFSVFRFGGDLCLYKFSVLSLEPRSA